MMSELLINKVNSIELFLEGKGIMVENIDYEGSEILKIHLYINI